jgi:hypothetical protein
MADQPFDPAQPGSIEASLLAKIPRHTFTIPETAKEFASDPTTVVLRQLTYAEETQAFAAAELRKTSFNYEGAMRAMVEADGKAITWTNNEKEIFFSGLSNKVRDLVIRAFAKVALPTVGEANDFLASEKITV